MTKIMLSLNMDENQVIDRKQNLAPRIFFCNELKLFRQYLSTASPGKKLKNYLKKNKKWAQLRSLDFLPF